MRGPPPSLASLLQAVTAGDGTAAASGATLTWRRASSERRKRQTKNRVASSDDFIAMFSADLLTDGRQRIVRHGAGPERAIQTGIGPIEVRRQKVRDRAMNVPAEAKIRFTSNILPKWARRSKSLDALQPVGRSGAGRRPQSPPL